MGVGQSYATIGLVRSGKTDTYPPAGSITTTALAEGAIEGTASDYEVANAHATEFAFSRFDAAKADQAPSKGALYPLVVDASSVERTPEDHPHEDAAQSRRLHEELVPRMNALEAQNAKLQALVASLVSTRSAGSSPVEAQSRRLSEVSTTCCAALDGCPASVSPCCTALGENVTALHSQVRVTAKTRPRFPLAPRIPLPGPQPFACPHR